MNNTLIPFKQVCNYSPNCTVQFKNQTELPGTKRYTAPNKKYVMKLRVLGSGLSELYVIMKGITFIHEDESWFHMALF